jgi:hypothetical protein
MRGVAENRKRSVRIWLVTLAGLIAVLVAVITFRNIELEKHKQEELVAAELRLEKKNNLLTQRFLQTQSECGWPLDAEPGGRNFPMLEKDARGVIQFGWSEWDFQDFSQHSLGRDKNQRCVLLFLTGKPYIPVGIPTKANADGNYFLRNIVSPAQAADEAKENFPLEYKLYRAQADCNNPSTGSDGHWFTGHVTRESDGKETLSSISPVVKNLDWWICVGEKFLGAEEFNKLEAKKTKTVLVEGLPVQVDGAKEHWAVSWPIQYPIDN